MNTPICSVASTSSSNFEMTTNVQPTESHNVVDLPENVIKNIFANTNYQDVLLAHRVCKRFQRLLRRNCHYLSRPHISEMSIRMGPIEKRLRPLGRVHFHSVEGTKKSRRRLSVVFVRKSNAPCNPLRKREYCVEEECPAGIDEHELSANLLECLGNQLMSVVVDGTLSFYGMAIDTNLYERLTMNWVKISNAHNLVFTLCRFRLRADYLRDLLQRTNCNKLSLELSQFDDTTLSDYVLEGISECHEFSASGTFPKYFAHLTDSTLNRWATQQRLPSRIFFQNVCANFTLDGILTMINSLQVKFMERGTRMISAEATGFEWNFGYVRLAEERSNIFELLSSPGLVVHVTNCDYIPNLLDVTLTPKHLPISPLGIIRHWPLVKFQLAMHHNKTN